MLVREVIIRAIVVVVLVFVIVVAVIVVVVVVVVEVLVSADGVVVIEEVTFFVEVGALSHEKRIVIGGTMVIIHSRVIVVVAAISIPVATVVDFVITVDTNIVDTAVILICVVNV